MRIALALLALALFATPAAAQNEWNQVWGAIAYGSAPERATGTAVDYPNPEAARQAAFENCGGRCTRAIVFQRTCGAVAAGTGGHGWDSNRWRGRAISRALKACAGTGPGCTLVAWACTAH